MITYVVPEKWQVKSKKVESWTYAWPDRNSKTKVHLGFAIPYADENSKKADFETFKKRIVTVDKWIGREPADTLVFDNTPIEGFRIRAPVTHSYNENVFWRVIDPRGFELEIGTDNLEELFNEANIEKGLIKGKALWAINGKKPHLLVVGTNPYKSSVNTVMSIKSHNIGDIIRVVVRGKVEEYTYFGKIYSLVLKGKNMNNDKNFVSCGIFSTHFEHFYFDGHSFLKRKEMFSECQIVGNNNRTPDEMFAHIKQDRRYWWAIGRNPVSNKDIQIKLIEIPTPEFAINSRWREISDMFCCEIEGECGLFHLGREEFRIRKVDANKRCYFDGVKTIPLTCKKLPGQVWEDWYLDDFVGKINKSYKLEICVAGVDLNFNW